MSERLITASLSLLLTGNSFQRPKNSIMKEAIAFLFYSISFFSLELQGSNNNRKKKKITLQCCQFSDILYFKQTAKTYKILRAAKY